MDRSAFRDITIGTVIAIDRGPKNMGRARLANERVVLDGRRIIEWDCYPATGAYFWTEVLDAESFKHRSCPQKYRQRVNDGASDVHNSSARTGSKEYLSG